MSNRRRLDRRGARGLYALAPLPPIPDTGDGYEQPGMVNGYRCPLGHIIYIRMLHAGTTPSGMMCRYPTSEGVDELVLCGLRAVSMWYQIPDREVTVTHEWYRPGDPERRTLSRRMADHVTGGGLLLRALVPPRAARKEPADA